MSEQRTEVGTGNGAVAASKTRKSEIAKSTVTNGVVTFTFRNNESVSCDVAKLPTTVQFDKAVEGVRMDGRLSFLRVEDPAKAAEALRTRFAKLLSGEVTTSRRGSKEPDALTQALMNLTKKSQDFIKNTWFPKYYASKESGCTTNVVKGKTRVYGKEDAHAKLMSDPGIKPEYDKIVNERNARTAKVAAPTKKLDLASIAT